MSTVLAARASGERSGARLPWLAIAAGAAALYIPTYLELARTLWRDDEYAHGPLVLGMFLLLAWMSWRSAQASRPHWVAGSAILAAGLVLYVVGRALAIPLFEVASHIPVLAGAVLLAAGIAGLRSFAFPIAFLVFLIPLPGFVTDAIAGPLKELVSAAVQLLLSFIGYPIVRSGVVLSIDGQHMLVADACSGMNSLFALFALTVVYLYLTGPSRVWRLVLLLASVIPIAIAANVVRVSILVLVAHHFGEDAASGALHTMAGLLVFIIALGLLIALDKLLPRASRSGTHGGDSSRLTSRVSRLGSRVSRCAAILAASLMFGAAVAAPLLKPVRAEGAAPDLERLVPASFGDWSIDPDVVPVAPSAEVQAKLDRIYGATLERTYVNKRGEHMMLAIAYGGDQSDALKAHRQEVCYRAQGFDIRGLSGDRLQAPGRSLPVTRMLAVQGARSEPVTYWFTMGDRVVRSRLERLGVQLRSGMHGVVPDGMLVRVSSLSTDARAAYAAQDAFITDLLASVPAPAATRLAGVPGT